jgi:hypothetical protein
MTDDDITFGELHLNNPGYACKLKNGKVATLTGTITTGGGCVGFVNLISTLAGSTATISKASGTVTVSNLSLRDITATGGATFVANNSIIQSNVNGWTVNTVTNRTLYWVGGTGNWNDMVHWSLSSGGSGGECPPTQADDTRFDNQSFSSTTDTLYIDVLQAA